MTAPPSSRRWRAGSGPASAKAELFGSALRSVSASTLYSIPRHLSTQQIGSLTLKSTIFVVLHGFVSFFCAPFSAHRVGSSDCDAKEHKVAVLVLRESVPSAGPTHLFNPLTLPWALQLGTKRAAAPRVHIAAKLPKKP